MIRGVGARSGRHRGRCLEQHHVGRQRPEYFSVQKTPGRRVFIDCFESGDTTAWSLER